MATNGNVNHSSADQLATGSSIMDSANRSSSNNNLSKDEVGWYFVEQYYTTLSKSPEKLHLFYSKRSQFVYGLEAEVANVSVGRQAIQEKIKALDFQDCKVRISNVDSQASDNSIVIQVIGETSNKAGEPKKFVQTFVLASQPSGYFVLNDILRYIDEDGDEEPSVATEKEQEPPKEEQATTSTTSSAVAQHEAPKQEVPAEDKQTAHLDAAVVDKKLEEVGDTEKASASTATTNTPAEASTESAAAANKVAAPEGSQDLEKTAQEIAEEDAKKPETPKDPTPTPTAARATAPEAAEPEKPKGPPKPMTWASRAAAAAGPVRPVVPLPKTATPPAQARPAVPAVAQPAVAPAAAAAPQPAEATPAASSSKDIESEWQQAKGDSKRQNRPQSVSGPPAEKEGTMAYIKYVTEKVKADDLKSALAGYGELAYFDINRQKNCAFVEFATQAGYAAAVAANPHTVNGESIIVEQRRPKANAYGGSNYSATRGGAAGRGRGGFDGNRSSSQGGTRGGFTGQARGRGGAPRGRAASQAANV